MNEYFLTTSKRTKEYSVLESCRLLLCLTFIHILRRITINFGNQLIFFFCSSHKSMFLWRIKEIREAFQYIFQSWIDCCSWLRVVCVFFFDRLECWR